MVKKQDESWQNTTSLPTSAHTRRYIDTCKEWLLTPITNVPKSVQICNIKPGNEDVFLSAKDCIGLYELDIDILTRMECYVCSTMISSENCKKVVANPFTRAQFMIMCADCDMKVQAKS